MASRTDVEASLYDLETALAELDGAWKYPESAERYRENAIRAFNDARGEWVSFANGVRKKLGLASVSKQHGSRRRRGAYRRRK